MAASDHSLRIYSCVTRGIFCPKVNAHARNKRPCHVVFCKATNRKIGDLDTKTTILNIYPSELLEWHKLYKKGSHSKFSTRRQLKKFNRSTKNKLKYESRSGKSHGPCFACEHKQQRQIRRIGKHFN